VVITENHLQNLEKYYEGQDTIYLFWVSLSGIQDYSLELDEKNIKKYVNTYFVSELSNLVNFQFELGEGTVYDMNGTAIQNVKIENHNCFILNSIKSGSYFLNVRDSSTNEISRVKLIKR
jgi:hypothetical protein